MSDLIKAEYETLIFHFRGCKVMVDNDLALLYGVSTKALKQQVKRNIGRFPEDYMFQLTKLEKEELVTICDRLATLKLKGKNGENPGIPEAPSYLKFYPDDHFQESEKIVK